MDHSDAPCLTGTWAGQNPGIAAPRLAMTDRAGRWMRLQIGTVLDCDWHTVSQVSIGHGSVFVDDEDWSGSQMIRRLVLTVGTAAAWSSKIRWTTSELPGLTEGCSTPCWLVLFDH